jgi:hypothetical protein
MFSAHFNLHLIKLPPFGAMRGSRLTSNWTPIGKLEPSGSFYSKALLGCYTRVHWAECCRGLCWSVYHGGHHEAPRPVWPGCLTLYSLCCQSPSSQLFHGSVAQPPNIVFEQAVPYYPVLSSSGRSHTRYCRPAQTGCGYIEEGIYIHCTAWCCLQGSAPRRALPATGRRLMLLWLSGEGSTLCTVLCTVCATVRCAGPAAGPAPGPVPVRRPVRPRPQRGEEVLLPLRPDIR